MKTGIYLLFLWCLILTSTIDLSGSVTSKDSLTLRLAKTNTDSGKITILNELANSYTETDMNICLDYAAEMLQLIDRLPNGNKKGVYYANAAIIYLDCNVYDKSLELLLKALQIFESSNNRHSIAITKNTMGGVYFRLSKSDLALKYFKEALEEIQKLAEEGDSTYASSLHIYYNNIGLVYGLKKDMAKNYFEKAIELANPSDSYNLGRYYNNIAPCYYETGNTKKAFEAAFKSMEYRKQTNNQVGIASTDNTLAFLYCNERDFKNAKEYLQHAISIGLAIKSNLILKNAYSMLIGILEEEKDFQTANKYLQEMVAIEKTLVNDTILARTTALKMEHDFAKKEALQEIKIQKTKLRQNLMLYVMIMLIIVIILIYFLLRSHNKRIQLSRKSLEQDLEIRNKELTTNVMYLMRNTDLIREIIDRLVKLRPSLKSDSSDIIKNIITDLQSLMKDDLWNEFEAHFNRVHLDFYRKLKGLFPDLTPTELRMCAFLRLNMSSKEISSMTGITVKSVEVMRVRIRKKLSITNTDINLINFLADF